MRHGEVWQLDGIKALIVSGDAFNGDGGGFQPVAVPLIRPHGQISSRYLVPTTAQDNVTGLFVIPALQPAPIVANPQRLTLISGATMAKIADGLTRLFTY